MVDKAQSRQKRRTKAQIKVIRDGLFTIAEKSKPATIRNLYYQATKDKLVPKTQDQYKNTVGRLLREMRRAGTMPYEWICDSSRWMRKPRTHSSLEAFLEISRDTYRRALWQNQKVDVEIWCESVSICGVLYPVTEEFDVPLMPAGGFSSMTFLFEAGMQLAKTTWPTHIYYFGDHDPSGKDIKRVVERDLRKHAPDAEIHFEMVAVTKEQIRKWKLPSNPIKDTDPRSDNFDGDRPVEIEAVDPDDLRQLCREKIEQHIDADALKQLQVVEEAERNTLATIVANLAETDEA